MKSLPRTSYAFTSFNRLGKGPLPCAMDDYDDDESISSKPYSSSGPSDVVNATGIASLDIREDNLSSHGRTWSGQPKSAGHDITEEFKHASKGSDSFIWHVKYKVMT